MLTLPFVRDMLDGHLLSSARGRYSTPPLLVIIEAVHSMDTLSCQVLARQRPFGAHTLRTRPNCVLGIAVGAGGLFIAPSDNEEGPKNLSTQTSVLW